MKQKVRNRTGGGRREGHQNQHFPALLNVAMCTSVTVILSLLADEKNG